MIRINLLPRHRRRRVVPEVGVVSVVVVVLAGLIASYVYGQIQNGVVRLETATLNRQIEQTRIEAAEVLALETKIERLRAKEELLKSLVAREHPWAEVLTDLARRTPRDLWLSSATFNSDSTPTQLTLGGTAFSYDGVARFMINLASSPFYADVDLNTAGEAEISGRTLITFSLVVTMRPNPIQIAAQGDSR